MLLLREVRVTKTLLKNEKKRKHKTAKSKKNEINKLKKNQKKKIKNKKYIYEIN